VGLVCICSVGMFGTLLVHSILSYVISAIFLATFRCFLFATFYGYVANMFGFEHYGAVVGVAALCSGVIGQLVIALNLIAYRCGFFYVNVGLMVVSGLFTPLALTLGVWERENVNDIENNTLGSKVTYKWSRIAMVSPRRVRLEKLYMSSEQ